MEKQSVQSSYRCCNEAARCT